MSYNYATVCYALFDLSAGTISFCNAGIPSPVLLKEDGGIEMLASNGPFVGIFDSSSYIDQSMSIERGDKVIFYTDGAYECMDDDGSFFGQKRFIESIKKRFALTIEGVVNGVFEETQIFCGGVKYTDDVTIVGIQIK
jgi:sigma-B regulation protein RsbU (phosphoserine phosphatase)